MPAPSAPARDSVPGLLRIGRDAPAEGSRHPLARALGPALETAYGIEAADWFPEEIAALAAALLGGEAVSHDGSVEERRLETA